MSAAHLPVGQIRTDVVGISTPEGAYQQVPISVVRCSCGRIHIAATEDTYGSSYDASFWLGVKFAQLNKWTELELPVDDARVTLDDASQG